MMAPSRSHAAIPAQSQGRNLLDGPVLPWALAAFGIFSVYGFGDLTAALRELNFGDTDDAMRLVEVRDLVAGQSWFDMIQHRFLPPAGVASHWSRLLDAPLAAAITVLTPLLGTSLAERVTTALWPPFLFLVYAAVLGGGVRRLFSPRTALFAIFAATQTIGLVLQFIPSRIDHHNVQILLLLGVGLSLMRPERSWGAAAIAGTLAAGSLAIGLEALPLVAIAGLIVVADWWLTGRAALPALLGFGLSLAISAALLFALQTAPALWSTSACDALSPPWLWLVGMGAMVAVAAAATQPERPVARFSLASGVGAIGLAAFAFLFPSCLHGPFTDMPELVRSAWLDQVREMQPLGTVLRGSLAEGLGVTAVIFCAAITAIVLAITDAAHRRSFTVASLFLGAGAIQTCFQLRGLYVASGFVPMIAGVCLDRALPMSSAAPVGKAVRIGLLVSVLALNAHVWMVAGRLADKVAGIGGNTQASKSQTASCLRPSAFASLAALPAGTVLAPIDLGPFLLAYTPHSIVAAPYHRAIAGLTAGIVVSEGTEAEVRHEAAATRATYLALCPAEDDKAFAGRLGRGEKADWLDPIPLEGSPIKMWRIR